MKSKEEINNSQGTSSKDSSTAESYSTCKSGGSEQSPDTLSDKIYIWTDGDSWIKQSDIQQTLNEVVNEMLKIYHQSCDCLSCLTIRRDCNILISKFGMRLM